MKPIDSTKWRPVAAPVLSLPGKALEDFTVRAYGGQLGYEAHYCVGPDFQHLHIERAFGASPLGPWSAGESTAGEAEHTRLYRECRLNSDQRVISAVWPGLPKCGLWLFSDTSYGMAKDLLLAPGGNGYRVVAANPCVAFDGERYHIFFEGRDETVEWNLFHATWNGSTKPGSVVVDAERMCPGANPSIFWDEASAQWFLYYSAKNREGRFDTLAFVQG